MKIVIAEVVEEQGKKVVRFQSNLGNGFGEWKSCSEPCKLNPYFVELNVVDQLVWSVNTFLSESKETLVQSINNDVLILQGAVEAMEDNGERCFMRLDGDLFIFSCRNIPFCTGEFVKIVARTVEVFDINL